ncbi:hypothetical protein K443DRAFT_418221 [Laccaria amethystina LaAM-08-1]|jgi:hypothetical protein|uniref:Uncharacterized protein n=1 Tax=Laccaria amethystina LaAM-08-1 TaxID=1095629 RepID=A0A0C9Y375_9AGAR|nr:hypothetical protein K443DRAFT_418221 [Laccaria amethystina LaAM-08-1]
MGADELPARRPDLKVDGRGRLDRIYSRCCVLGLHIFLFKYSTGYLRPCGRSLVRGMRRQAFKTRSDHPEDTTR